MRKLALAPIAFVLLLLTGCGGSSGGDTTGSAAAGSATETAAPSGVVLPAAPLTGAVGKGTRVGPQSPKLRWKLKLEGPVVPGPAVGKGVVYAASNGGTLHAIDLRSGKDIWTFDGGGSYGSDLSTVPALLAGGEVLWPGPENTLFALDSEGHELWSEQLPAQPTSPIVTADGNVVVGDTAGTLEQLKLQPKGKPQVEWKVELGDTSFSSPALGKDGTVYTTTEKGLYAVKDGKVLWNFASSSISEVSPAVAPDGTIILGTNDSEYGISPGGKELWRHKNGTRTYSSPVVTEGGLVYYGDNAGSLTVLDSKDGTLEAHFGEGKHPGIWSAPAVDSKHDVYFGSQNGGIYAYDASGKQLFKYETGGGVDSYGALAEDGTLLIGSEDGSLYALGGK